MSKHDLWRQKRDRYRFDFRRWLFPKLVVVAGVLAVPVAALSLTLLIDGMLSTRPERGIAYQRTLHTDLRTPDYFSVDLYFPDRPGCRHALDQYGLRYIEYGRPTCTGSVGVAEAFGERLKYRDSLRVDRTPIWKMTARVTKLPQGPVEEAAPQFVFQMLVVLGLMPLIIFAGGYGRPWSWEAQEEPRLVPVIGMIVAELFFVGNLLHSAGLIG